MKKLFSLAIILTLFTTAFTTRVIAQNAFEQGKTVGFASILLESGYTPLSLGVEYGASDQVGVGARLIFVTGSYGGTGLQAFGNYHLAQAFNASGDKLDPYVGVGLGKYFVEGSEFFAGLQLGTRYLVNEQVGPFAQLNIGVVNSSGATFEIGAAYKFGR